MFPWGEFPFNEDLKKMAKEMNPADIQAYVNKMLHDHVPGQRDQKVHQEKEAGSRVEQGADNQIDAKVFETFDHVYVRIPLQDEGHHRKLKFYHTSNQAIIDNYFGNGERQTITLPCLVKRKGASAIAKENILEVKIPRSIDMQFSEVDIGEDP